MNPTILLIALSVSLTISTFGQTSVILRYFEVTEFEFDYDSANYTETARYEVSGAISIDPVKVFIKGYNDQNDKTLIIVEKQKEEGTDRDMYICEMNGERYAVAISPDKKYLTIIGVDDKCIYDLKE